MITKIFQGLLVFFISVASSAEAILCNEFDANIIGLAKDKKNNFLYCEYHFVDAENNSQVEYRDKSGDLIAEKRVTYNVNNLRPSVKQQDFRLGEVREVDSTRSRLLVQYQKHQDAKRNEFSVEVSPELIVDAGFDNAIRQYWSNLIQEKSVKLDFVSLVNGNVYRLKVKRKNSKTCAKQPYNLDEHICFVVKSTSSLANLFIRPISLLYDRESKRLLMFAGQVNILDESSKPQSALITYRYE